MKDGFDGLVEHLLDGGLFLQQAIEILEKSMIQGALQNNQGNQCAAAKQLGIHRNTLQRKMVTYEVGRCASACTAKANDACRATAQENGG